MLLLDFFIPGISLDKTCDATLLSKRLLIIKSSLMP